MELYFHTNTAQLPSQRTQDLLKEFKRVLINASIDDVEERNEYIRYPTTWEQTQRFIEWGEATGDNIDLDVYVTIQNMNIYHLTDIQDYWFSQRLTKFNKNIGGFVHAYPCHMPEKFSTRNLPPKLKRMVREKFDNWKQKAYQEYLNYSTAEDPIITENRMWALERMDLLVHNMEYKDLISPHLNKSNEEHYDDFIQWTMMQDKIRGTDYTKVFPWLTTMS